MIVQLYAGCMSNSQREPTTRYIPRMKNRPVHQVARTQPARSRNPRARGPNGSNACGVSCSCWTTVTRSLPFLRRSCQVLHESVDLLRRERLAERRRHHALLEAGDEIRVRIDDRLLHIGGERLPGLRGVGRQVVEVRPDLAAGSGRLERMAAAAAAAPKH